jgi:hypothetical protein
MQQSFSYYSSRQLPRYRAMSIAGALLAISISGAALLGWIPKLNSLAAGFYFPFNKTPEPRRLAEVLAPLANGDQR